MALKTVLIDDEPLASAELKVLLKEHEEIEVCGSAEDYQSALLLIKEIQPDLIFLDVNMPEKNGFELLEELEEVPQVIFVTAHDQYALNAYEVSALDYLLKPVNPKRLSEAIGKVQKNSNSVNSEESNPQKIDINKRIFIKDGERCFFVPLSEIFLIESMGNYARLYYRDQKPLLHRSLTYLEERLPSEYFFRANRQQIVHLEFIEEIYPYFNSSLKLRMNSGHEVEISQRQSTRFREITGI